MNDVYFTPKRGEALQISADDEARLFAMTDAEIQTGAENDPENPPTSEARLQRSSSVEKCGASARRREDSDRYI